MQSDDQAPDADMVTRLCDAILPGRTGLPGGAGLPSASQVGVPGVIVRECADDQVLAGHLATLGAALDAGESVEQVLAAGSPSFAALRTRVCEIYYTDADALDALEQVTGWRARNVLTGSAMLPFDETLLARVRELAPAYRDATVTSSTAKGGGGG